MPSSSIRGDDEQVDQEWIIPQAIVPAPSSDNAHVDGVCWPNENWRISSKLVNACRMSDSDANLFLDTMRMMDPRLGIPKNILELRKFERSNLGPEM